VGGSAGAGADPVTITINTDGGTPIADVDVWVTTTSDPDDSVAASGQTDANGQVEFMLDAGSTYYLWKQKSGINFSNPTSFVAVAD